MNKDFIDYFSIITTTIGTLLGFWGIYLTINSNYSITDLALQVNHITFVLSIFLFFLFLIYFKKNLLHRRYARGYNSISNGFTISHKLRDSERINDLSHAINCIEQFCTKISDAFSIFTNRTTSVCIKLFHITEDGDVCLKTFCRDANAHSNDKRINPDEDETIHYLSENTDFKFIFENVDKEGANFKYYFSNNLPLEDFYRNSRLDYNIYPPKSNIFIWKEIKRYLAWNLPYRSTITVPITPLSDKKINEEKIIGFLCVDSPSIWAFNKDLDITIFRGIADGLYSTIKKLSDIHFQGVHNSTKQKKRKNN